MAGLLDDLKMQYRTGGPEIRLIFLNVAVFILSLFFFSFRLRAFDFPDWLALYSDIGIAGTRPWTFLTYAFLHAGFFHLLFNMLVLQFSGVLFRTFFSNKQFYGLYLLSAIFAGLVFCGAYALLGQMGILVGASASIMSILVATATYSPNMRIRLILFGEVKLWVLAVVLLGFDTFYLLIENTGGHISHLAGALFGFSFVKLLQQGIDLSRPVTWLFDFIANGGRPNPKAKFKKVHKNPQPQSSVRQPVEKDRTQQQIDEILDKISRSGYESLSKEEKDFLFRAGNR